MRLVYTLSLHSGRGWLSRGVGLWGARSFGSALITVAPIEGWTWGRGGYDIASRMKRFLVSSRRWKDVW